MVKYPQDAPPENPIFKVGDKVVCIKELDSKRPGSGDLGKVYAVANDGHYTFEMCTGWWARKERFRLATPEDLKPKGPEPIGYVVKSEHGTSAPWCRDINSAKDLCRRLARGSFGTKYSIYPIFGSVYECTQPKLIQPDFIEVDKTQ